MIQKIVLDNFRGGYKYSSQDNAALIKKHSENTIPKNAFSIFKNLFIDKNDTLRKVGGGGAQVDATNYTPSPTATDNKINGLFAKVVNSTTRYVLFGYGTKLYMKTNSDANEMISGTFSADTKRRAPLIFIDRSDLTNQADNLYIIAPRYGADDTTAGNVYKYLFKDNSGSTNAEDDVRAITLPVGVSGSAVTATATADGAGLPVGTYYYKFTYTLNTGVETNCGAFETVIVADEPKKISFLCDDIANGYVKYINIYRTKKDMTPTDTYYYVDTIQVWEPGNAYWAQEWHKLITDADPWYDTVQDTALLDSEVYVAQDFATITAVCGCYGAGRLWLSDGKTVYYSDSGVSDSIRVALSTTFLEGTKNPITGMEFYKSVVYLFQKNGGIWTGRETGSSVTPFIFEKISDDIGLDPYNNIIKHGGAMYWGYKGSIYQLNGGATGEIFAPEQIGAYSSRAGGYDDVVYNTFLFTLPALAGEGVGFTTPTVTTYSPSSWTLNPLKQYISEIDFAFLCPDTDELFYITNNQIIGKLPASTPTFTFYDYTTSNITATLEKPIFFQEEVMDIDVVFYGTGDINFKYKQDDGAYSDTVTVACTEMGTLMAIGLTCKKITLHIEDNQAQDFAVKFVEVYFNPPGNKTMKDTSSGGAD